MLSVEDMKKPANALAVGTAAEHLVCADLILSGYKTSMASAGLAYDVIMDHNGRLFRVQVKASVCERSQSRGGKDGTACRMQYIFGVRCNGKFNRKRLSDDDCDIVAMVALDIRKIAYFPVAVCAQAVRLDKPGTVRTTKSGQRTWARTIDEFPIERAVENDAAFYSAAIRSRPAACPQGHPYSDDNIILSKRGWMLCRECNRLRSLRNSHRRKERDAAARIAAL